MKILFLAVSLFLVALNASAQAWSNHHREDGVTISIDEDSVKVYNEWRQALVMLNYSEPKGTLNVKSIIAKWRFDCNGKLLLLETRGFMGQNGEGLVVDEHYGGESWTPLDEGSIVEVVEAMVCMY